VNIVTELHTNEAKIWTFKKEYFSSPNMMLRFVNMVPYGLFSCSHYPFAPPKIAEHIKVRRTMIAVITDTSWAHT
jgi:hypothetical protein